MTTTHTPPNQCRACGADDNWGSQGPAWARLWQCGHCGTLHASDAKDVEPAADAERDAR
jgi:ribosomal protein L37AE/L43A